MKKLHTPCIKTLLATIFCLLLFSCIDAQPKFLLIKKSVDSTALPAATIDITSLNKSIVADNNGLAIISDFVAGNYAITISHVGYQSLDTILNLTLQVTDTLTIYLVEIEYESEEEEDVIVTATRTSRSISDIPTRVETISGEELQEKANMKPGDIRMMLNESTGVQSQQTSATSNNFSIRIQGLDGRYTQLLRDGLPLYAGFSGGLSLMQITPLDLQQVEIIKGSTSTLYGGGAIAGLVNLVSKTPQKEKELSFLANATSAKGLDLSGFYSKRFKNIGLTVFGSRNSSSAYDPAGIGLTAIPEFTRYNINPNFLIYGKKINAKIGVNYVTEDRLGGNINYIKNQTSGYFEKNKSDRFSTQLAIDYNINENGGITIKNSYNTFNRQINIPNYIFEGKQQSSYTEINYHTTIKKTVWIAGANLITDDFKEVRHYTTELRNYTYNTAGVFVQNTFTTNNNLTVETGLRTDYTKQYGISFLPRVAIMQRINPKLTIRIGGGLGYKTPTVFNEESERIQFKNIVPVNEELATNERSSGANLDINYRTKIGGLGFTINQLFFLTRINKPLVLTNAGSGMGAFINANGFIDTKGLETNLRFTYKDFKLFIGYTYADVNSHFNQLKEWFPLTAKHRLNNVLMYELEEKWKIGFEAYYFSPQKLSDGATGRDYWINGLMIEKLWQRFSVFINFENIFDTRQTKFDTIYTGTIDNPVFRDIYAPVDGFLVNGGIKIRL
ncbi:MAG: TonB-dependent receptor [Bacteroidota bacterium]